MSTPGLTDYQRDAANGALAIAKRLGLEERPAAVHGAVVAYDEALAAERAARAGVADAAAALADAQALAELGLRSRVTREGNKTFFDGEQVSADEARALLAREVAKDQDVIDAMSTKRAADVALEEARDRVAVAEHKIRAARAFVDSAIAEAQLFAVVIGGGR